MRLSSSGFLQQPQEGSGSGNDPDFFAKSRSGYREIENSDEESKPFITLKI